MPEEQRTGGQQPDAKSRMKRALDLYELSAEIMLQNFRRRHPDADERTIRELFQQWLLERPGAEHGDASGPHFRVRKLEL
jgi:hypothetical protein